MGMLVISRMIGESIIVHPSDKPTLIKLVKNTNPKSNKIRLGISSGGARITRPEHYGLDPGAEILPASLDT